MEMPCSLCAACLCLCHAAHMWHAQGSIQHPLDYLSGCRLRLFNPARVYDLFGEMLSALNIFSLFLCLFIYLKGKWAPSSSDSGTTGSLIYDFFWGEMPVRCLKMTCSCLTTCT